MKAAKATRVRRKYDEQFKLQALKMIDSGQSVRSVSQTLGVSQNLLHKWKQSKPARLTSLEEENVALKARLKQLETERDILKKALSIFSRPS